MTPLDLHRVVVLGSSGAGKTTFARELAHRLECPHIELDALYWERNWTPREADVLRAVVADAIAAERWVIDGGYTGVRDLIWRRATSVVWLDYSFPRVFYRAVRRTVQRVITGAEVHNGNRETFRHGFLSWDGIPCWVVRTYRSRRREYSRLLACAEYSHLRAVIFSRPREAEAFLAGDRDQSW